MRCHWFLDRPHSCHRLPCPEQVGDADQVVGHHMQPEHRFHLGPASGLELPETCGLFDPAKNLFNSLSGVDRLGITLVAGGAAINC